MLIHSCSDEFGAAQTCRLRLTRCAALIYFKRLPGFYEEMQFQTQNYGMWAREKRGLNAVSTQSEDPTAEKR